MSLASLLTVLFIALKLTNVITWSWWLVLLPLYSGAIIGFIIFVVGLLAMATLDRSF